MTALEDFENTLKEVVNAKRLSASKMNRLTEIAMKSLADDTKLVAILYRTHKSLPGSAKVSSLYAFDALARAARNLVNKRGATGETKSETGNAATFLLKIEGVLDGLFQDMATLNNLEAKEKTKKVLEIWVKSNTFPSAVLARLRDILSDVPKETALNPTTPSSPHAATQAPAIDVTSPVPQVPTEASPNVHATLLALLGQAAQATNSTQPASQTTPNNDPQLQQSQLVLLQQLALAAKLANGTPTPPPRQTPPPPPSLPPADGNPSLPERPLRTGDMRPDPSGDTRYARNGHQDYARDRHEFRDERPLRGGSRGGPRGRGRWDEHHSRDRFRYRDRDPPLRARRSRSRSPRRMEEWRNPRPNSPPRYDRDPRRRPESPTPPVDTHGKDEFGRDIRESSGSPSRSTSVEDTQTHAQKELSVDPTSGVTPDNHIPVSDQMPSVAAGTPVESTETRSPSSTKQQQQQPGLDQFDVSTFDATAPSSWEALGNMWQTTYGYTPSQEELMQFVMAGTMAAAGVANGGFSEAQGGQWQQESWGNHGAQHNGGWRGRGGYGRGNEGELEQSDAVVLNGDEPEPSDDGGQTGGRMQRVGDKWLFVREPLA